MPFDSCELLLVALVSSPRASFCTDGAIDSRSVTLVTASSYGPNRQTAPYEAIVARTPSHRPARPRLAAVPAAGSASSFPPGHGRGESRRSSGARRGLDRARPALLAHHACAARSRGTRPRGWRAHGPRTAAADDATERRTRCSAVSHATGADSAPLPTSRTGAAICALHPGGCTVHAALKSGLSTTSPVVFRVYRPGSAG